MTFIKFGQARPPSLIIDDKRGKKCSAVRHKIFFCSLIQYCTKAQYGEKECWRTSLYNLLYMYLKKYDIFRFFLNHLRGVQHTAEIISAVCIIPQRRSLYTPQRRSQRCATHRGDHLHDVQHTEEINCGNTAETKSNSSLAVNETIRRNPFRGEHIYHER